MPVARGVKAKDRFKGSGSFDCGFGISDFGLKRLDGADTGYGLVPIVLVVVLVPRLPQNSDPRGRARGRVRKNQIRSHAHALRPQPLAFLSL